MGDFEDGGDRLGAGEAQHGEPAVVGDFAGLKRGIALDGIGEVAPSLESAGLKLETDEAFLRRLGRRGEGGRRPGLFVVGIPEADLVGGLPGGPVVSPQFEDVMAGDAAPLRHDQQIGGLVSLARLQEEDGPLRGDLPGHAVADGGMPDRLVRREDDLGRRAKGAGDLIDFLRGVGELLDAGAHVRLGQGRAGCRQDGGGEKERRGIHRMTSGSAR